SQAEQVAAGLAGVVDRGRATAPHLGVGGPGSAWSLWVSRWRGREVREAKLRLPWLPDIRNPELMIKIKYALRERVGVHVSLSTDPLRDEITITVLNGPDEESPDDDLRELAAERARIAAAMILKGTTVTLHS